MMKKWIISIVIATMMLVGCSSKEEPPAPEKGADIQSVVSESEEQLPTSKSDDFVSDKNDIAENEGNASDTENDTSVKVAEVIEDETLPTPVDEVKVSETEELPEVAGNITTEEPLKEDKQVLFTVYDGKGNTIGSEKIPYSEGITAFSVIRDYGEDVKYRGLQGMEYVYSAYGLEERAQGPMSGWVYTINGKEMMKGAPKAKLAPGDVLEWYYANAQ